MSKFTVPQILNDLHVIWCIASHSHLPMLLSPAFPLDSHPSMYIHSSHI